MRVLQGLYGFHSEWEKALASSPLVADFLMPRSRTSRLVEDLLALGSSQAAIAALPLCGEAWTLARGDAEALGSAYVMEGSTLGGTVIARALADADWLPPGGLRYFDPYGERTGEMWRAFKAWLCAHPAAGDRPGVTRGALRTFEALQTWMAG